jgi:hypothetical protein
LTKCAARTGPIAALLSAIEIAATGYPLPLLPRGVPSPSKNAD